MTTATEHIVCPNCRAEVLFPPSLRTINIALDPGCEPVVAAPGMADWEVEAALRRAWQQYAEDEDEGES